MSGGKIAAAIIGAIAALIAAALLFAGVTALWAWTTQRTDDGYFESDEISFESDGYAVTSSEIDLGSQPGDWVPSGVLGTVRITADADDFVGIGPADDVESYLAGVRQHEVTDLEGWWFSVEPSYRLVDGTETPAPPADQNFWAASGTGALTWEVESGNWVVVLMNADGSAGVAADVVGAAQVEWLLAFTVGILVVGLLFALLAALLLVIAFRRPAEVAMEPIPAVAPGEFGRYPVLVEGDLDPSLSRWMWLLKWLLAIPHYIVVAVLWFVAILLTIVAFFAILFTGRYPRTIFDFNVGVMRWTWRVGYYSYSALGTDSYPPFSLRADDYPARLDVAYPQQLSRGLVLVKWWLLAIPHYIVVGFFTSGLIWWAEDFDGGWAIQFGGGLIGILVLVAAIVLLFTGKYPQGIFDIVMAMNRWAFRVGAYALLMRDEYPPFHFDMGGREPVVAGGRAPDTEGDVG